MVKRPLRIAKQMGREEIVGMLLEQALMQWMFDDRYGAKLLHWAIYRSHPKIVKVLLGWAAID
ncbi:MAG: ankyrin repeat domain-containing protein [Puniceicoccales bacterium]|jgi:ankyrin repeat protein|nr:ankyrin repeat domain-containing protein [Puniceicoccales bacterium]